MPHRQMAGQPAQALLGEDLRHQPHALVLAYPLAVGGDNPGALLAAVLEGVESEICQFGRVRVSEYTTDTTLFAWPQVVLILRHSRSSR